MKSAVVVFPGSNCDRDAARALERLTGKPTAMVWHKDTALPEGTDLVVLPGGFSYGDYLRSGSIARFSPVMAAIREHAAAGGAVLGICNGFQILCEAHLLPGALMHNAGRRFASRPVDLRIERTDTICTGDFEQGEVIRIPQAHGEGRYEATPAVLETLERDNLIVLRYVPVSGSDIPYNPNGSTADIAGICNPAGNVVGFMPHPERLADSALGSEIGMRFFTGLIKRLSGVPT